MTPVLLLTARDEVDDRVAGLDAGADDYLTKPFAFAELLARTRALLRRPPLQTDERVGLGRLELDRRLRTVRVGSTSVNLSAREYALLDYLLRHAGQVLTRTQIGEAVWGLDFEHESNVVDVYVGYLRRKLSLGSEGPTIRTVRGVGYVLEEAGMRAWSGARPAQAASGGCSRPQDAAPSAHALVRPHPRTEHRRHRHPVLRRPRDRPHGSARPRHPGDGRH